MRRVVLTGPECTGKTTLAAALAARCGVPWVMEGARRYAEGVRRPLTADDVWPIAALEARLLREGAAAAADAALLVCDTDLWSTVVYARHHYGWCPPAIESAARAMQGSDYLLCAPDLAWTGDAVRGRADDRARLAARFRAVLAAAGARVHEVSGTGEARMTAAWRAMGMEGAA